MYGHLVYFVAMWYTFPVLVGCAEKNLATLISASFNCGSAPRMQTTCKQTTLPLFPQLFDGYLENEPNYRGISPQSFFSSNPCVPLKSNPAAIYFFSLSLRNFFSY
jgi:hypothetical protein